MQIGTKSVLFGAHCFFIHPWFVAWAWWRLYGFPRDFRLWLAFFVHDLGYWGKPNMDGEEGELHPYWGAMFMSRFDGWYITSEDYPHREFAPGGITWYDFTLHHSRFLAKRNKAQYSMLCVADKLAIVLTPSWLYLPMVRLTGEIHEYRSQAEVLNPGSNAASALSDRDWFIAVKKYVAGWVDEHRDCRVKDTWTKTRETESQAK